MTPANQDQLAESFVFCSTAGMERIDPAQLTAAIRQAPGWARIGLIAPSERVREQAIWIWRLSITQTIYRA